jgi:hypothetical protein
MDNNNTTRQQPEDLSYFKLSLLDFLINSHPELVSNTEFINARSDAAAEAHEQAILAGHNQIEASELSNEVLFADLHFSKHDTLVKILWREFSSEVPEDEAIEMSIELLPICEPVFALYTLTDDFASSPDYELLYTELTGTISIYLEEQ